MIDIKKLFSNKNSELKNIYGKTDVGRIRDNNEDYYLIIPEKNLYIVSDGMGGQNAGEVASFNASKAIDSYFSKDKVKSLVKNPKNIKDELNASIQFAHKKILALQKEKPQFSGMGCTIIVAFIVEDVIHLSHVGDTRGYLLEDKEMVLLTTDHSYVMELVKQGKMTAEEARKSNIKNQLRQAIGAPMDINPDYNIFKMRKGNRLLLCSDGLWDTVSDEAIKSILSENRAVKEICSDLVNKANMEGGHDNITVLVYEFISEISGKSQDPNKDSNYGIVFDFPQQ